jgi:hypothetical protein
VFVRSDPTGAYGVVYAESDFCLALAHTIAAKDQEALAAASDNFEPDSDDEMLAHGSEQMEAVQGDEATSRNEHINNNKRSRDAERYGHGITWAQLDVKQLEGMWFWKDAADLVMDGDDECIKNTRVMLSYAAQVREVPVLRLQILYISQELVAVKH